MVFSLPDFTITSVGPEADELLTNLFELYLHDMAEWLRFENLDSLGLYHYDMSVHHEAGDEVYLLKKGNQPAGFAIVGSGEKHGGGEGSHDIDEFFVTRIYRHSGIARTLSRHVWNLHSGSWTIRVYEGNKPAIAFWQKTIAEYTNNNYTETLHMIEDKYPWKYFSFYR